MNSTTYRAAEFLLRCKKHQNSGYWTQAMIGWRSYYSPVGFICWRHIGGSGMTDVLRNPNQFSNKLYHEDLLIVTFYPSFFPLAANSKTPGLCTLLTGGKTSTCAAAIYSCQIAACKAAHGIYMRCPRGSCKKTLPAFQALI